MNEIAWHEFSWEAFATFLAGFMAIAGAIYVGRKQSNILAKQVGISEKQVFLEETKLRADLFDRRMEVYNATIAWIGILNTEGPPSKSHENDIGFFDAMHSSRFLFRPEVSDHLKRMNHLSSQCKHYAQLQDWDNHFEVHSQLIEMSNFDKILEIFSPEMSLDRPVE